MFSTKLTLGAHEYCYNIDENIHEKVTNWSVARHCNAEYELHIVLGGSCTLDVGERAYTLERGDALLIAPTVHHCSIETSPDLRNFILSFDIIRGSRERGIFDGTAPCIRLRITEYVLDLCEGILRETRQRSACWRDAVQARYTLILCELTRRLCADGEQDGDDGVPSREHRFALIDTFFEQYCEEMGAEAELAEQLHISTRQLSRILRRCYGMSFREKLLRARLDRAALLLRTTDMAATDISAAVGYLSEPSFYKAFKKYYGKTPDHYRKEYYQNGTDT